jgi:hypothetical protein
MATLVQALNVTDVMTEVEQLFKCIRTRLMIPWLKSRSLEWCSVGQVSVIPLASHLRPQPGNR